MALISGGGGGGSMPAQWVIDPATGGLVVTLTGAEGGNDYNPVQQIVNSDGKTLFSYDSAGEANFTAQNADIGVLTVNVDSSVGTLLPRASVLSLYNDATSGLGWWFTGSGHEAHGARAEAADANIHASEAWDSYDATNGAAKFLRKGRTADGTIVKTTARMSPSGAIITGVNAAPADAELQAGEMALWFDKTNGAGKLMIKAKTANGTVVTGNVALA